ncbi:MAG: hypothetical protein E7011_04500 [Alphaproteobacteria bacterium]|nr:hypothetical protein [Alphaproteobacteria bacterium]
MKPTMLYAVIMLVAIVLMTSFGITLSPTEPIAVSAAAAPNTLYVCPAASSVWDTLANGLGQFTRPIIIGFIFVLMLLVFSWCWALYQNLLKDKFMRDAFKTSWGLTKLYFWGIVIVLMLILTPNYFRSVRVDGMNAPQILCESNSPGARAVPAESVHTGH